MSQNKLILRAIAFLIALLAPQVVWAQGQCVVSILNRTAEVKPDGTWEIFNLPVPAAGLQVRARFTCTENGVTERGQSRLITLTPGITNGFQGDFDFDSFTPIPTRILLQGPAVLNAIGAQLQLTTTATLPDDSEVDVTQTSTGTSYRCTTPGVATIDENGLVTAVTSGVCMLIAQHEGRTATHMVTVTLAADTDGDGIPDDIELANGMDPNNPLDALEDSDGDGLTNSDEVLIHNTDPFEADSDGDQVNDQDEVNDGTDPNDPDNVNFAGKGLIQSIDVSPSSMTLRTNTIIPQEVSQQLTVTATLTNNQLVNITPEGTGTTYVSNNLLVANFGEDDGRIFAGNPGLATITVANSGVSVDVPVEVTSFAPTALSFLSIPGSANNCDVDGSFCYVAAGSTGLQIVDVSDPTAPSIVSSVDTPGNANDVKFACATVFIADGTNGLVAIDATDPLNPALLSTFDTPGTANDVQICGAFAFVADGSNGLCIVDITDPENMFQVGAVTLLGTSLGVDCDLGSNVACVVGSSGLHVVDISVISAPTEVGMLGVGSATDVVVQGINAFVTIGGGSGHLTSVDISDPTNPSVGVDGETPPQSNLTDVALDQVGLALCSDVISDNRVHTFNIFTPSSPVPALLIDFFVASGRDDNGTGIDTQQGVVYMTGIRFAGNGGLHIGRYLDINDNNGIPPTVALTAPADGSSIVEGTTVLVTADADDDIGVARVEFLRDGQVVGVDNLAPYQTLMAAPPGAPFFQASARAVDFGGNVSSTAAVTVNVTPDQPPTVELTAPADGDSIVEGTSIPATADASDDVAVAQVEFLRNGVVVAVDNSAPYEAQIADPGGVPSFQVSARATDSVGNVTTTGEVTVNVIPDPLTTVIGCVEDPDGIPIVGANVTVNGGLAGVTDGTGCFSIPNVPTILGDIQASANAIVNTVALTGTSDEFAPVVGGITDVGTFPLNAGLVPGEITLLITAADGGAPVTLMLNTGLFTSINVFNTRFGTPTLGFLQGFDVVMNYTNFIPTNPVGLGNVLADYVDGGGHVVLCTYSFSNPWDVRGRIRDSGYSPLVGISRAFPSGSLTFTQPTHPIFNNPVALLANQISFFRNSNFSNPTLDGGATLLATIGTTPCIAINASNNVYGVNLFPSISNNTDPDLFQLFSQICTFPQ